MGGDAAPLPIGMFLEGGRGSPGTQGTGGWPRVRCHTLSPQSNKVPVVQHAHHMHPLTPLITYSNEPFPPGSPPGHLSPEIDPKTGELGLEDTNLFGEPNKPLGTTSGYGEQRQRGGAGNVLGIRGCLLDAASASWVVSTQSLGGGWGSLPSNSSGWGVGIPPGLCCGCFSSAQPGVMGAEGNGAGREMGCSKERCWRARGAPRLSCLCSDLPPCSLCPSQGSHGRRTPLSCPPITRCRLEPWGSSHTRWAGLCHSKDGLTLTWSPWGSWEPHC